jgi:hypothetical protein
MKILNTVQNLWSHCLFCPICRKETREIKISVGPDEVFELTFFEKKDNLLTLNCSAKIKNNIYYCEYIINCDDNKFRFAVSGTSTLSTELTVDKASSPYFYFYLFSNCKECGLSYLNSNDLELDLLNDKIVNIGLEREGMHITHQNDSFLITISYGSNTMLISRAALEEGVYATNGEPAAFPITDLDFSNPGRLINKIKTMLLFS